MGYVRIYTYGQRTRARVCARSVSEGKDERKSIMLMDKMFVRKQTGPIVGNRLMGACH